jgi:hypothetical protein
MIRFTFIATTRKTEKLRADLSEHTRSHIRDLQGKSGKQESLIKAFIKEYLPIAGFDFQPVFAAAPALPVAFAEAHYRPVVSEVVSSPPRFA